MKQHISVILFAVPVLLPIGAVLFSLLGASGESWAHIQDTRLKEYLLNTLVLMLLTGTIAGVLGTLTAWLTVSYRFPFDRSLAVLLLMPLAAPAYVVGYVYADLLSYAGPVQSSLREIFDWGYGDYWFPAIRSLPGASAILALSLYPYVYLLVRANLERQSATLSQAARSLGAHPGKLLWQVTLPLARPAFVGGLALVLMETVADFGVVQHFGVPTMTTGIFRTWLAMGERTTAMQLAAWLFLMVALLILMEQAARKGDRFNPVAPDSAAVKKPLGFMMGILCTLVCALPVVLGLVLPLYLLTVYAVTVGDPMLGRSFLDYIGNTVLVAGITAVICVVAALALSYAARLRSTVFMRYGIRVATLGYAVPGMVLAVGALAPLTAMDHVIADIFRAAGLTPRLWLTGSIAALIFVYVARYLTVGYNTIHQGLEQINPGLDAVARTLGAGPSGVLRRIHAPLLRPVLLYAALLVFIDVVKELPATLILRPFNFETLATRVYRLASDERLAEASTAAIVIVLVSLVPTIILTLRQR